jgi:tRNA-specific adenosine deaminase 1
VAELWRFAKPKAVPAVSSQNGDVPHAASMKKSKPGNISAVWALAPSYRDSPTAIIENGSKTVPTLCRSKTGLYETIVNGVKQGNRASAPGARGASALSRAKLWALFRNITSAAASIQSGHGPELMSQASDAESLQAIHVRHNSVIGSYIDFKEPSGLEDPLSIRIQAISDAKRVLKGWIPNAGDETWDLDVLIDPKKRKVDFQDLRSLKKA